MSTSMRSRIILGSASLAQAISVSNTRKTILHAVFVHFGFALLASPVSVFALLTSTCTIVMKRTNSGGLHSNRRHQEMLNTWHYICLA